MGKKINLTICEVDESEADEDYDHDEITAYLYLPQHPFKLTPGCVKKTIWLSDLMPGYKGPRIYLDFDAEDVLIGIEILD